MKQGFLSQYFDGIAFKRLSAVEVNVQRSNQHEFNGSKALRKLLGENTLNNYPVTFVWFGDENEGISEESSVTWYDARANHPTRTEWRLYFRNNHVSESAEVGDLLIVARRPNKEMYIIIVKADTTFENQLLWLFGVQNDIDFTFNFHFIGEENDPKIDFAVRYILEELGIEIEEPDSVQLDNILEPYFNKGFPPTKEFSLLARNSVTDVSSVENPDTALILWVEKEEKLFKRLERYLVQEKLDKGFSPTGDTDVEGFLKFSLSVHNRRKSRAGHSLENHIEEVFIQNNIYYSRGKITENRSRPDFLFPSIECYNSPSYPTGDLTMLGVKSTCKDRWRQVLSEAERIKNNHLFTLEPGISENQIFEMQANKLQLVLPKSLHETYNTAQQKWLMDLGSFISFVKERQKTYFASEF